jgi:SPP1 gp7 family putative phage head morphogenesis protein
MPVHRVPGGWRWGLTGKTYRSKAQAERQARAIYANGWRADTRAKAHQALSASRRAESRYVLDVLRILGQVHAGVLHVVRREHLQRARDAELRHDERDVGLGPDLLRRILRFVRPETERAFDSMAAEVNAAALRGSVLVGIQPRSVPGLAKVIATARASNVNLITSASSQFLRQVRDVLDEHEGQPAETISAALQERVGVSKSRGQLIARDQTLKLNAQITQHRQRAAGIVSYRWSTSHDERVRESHRALDGQVFSWDDPPETTDDGDSNHPGEDFQCRCVAIPIVDTGEEGEEGEETEGAEGPAAPPEPAAAPGPPPENERVPLSELGIRSTLDKAGTQIAEMGIARAEIRKYLKTAPLSGIGPMSEQQTANGLYYPGLQKLELNSAEHFEAGHADDLWYEKRVGRKLAVGDPETWSMSSLGTSPGDKRQRTLVHELGHHVHINAAKRLPGRLEQEIRDAFHARVNEDGETRPGKWVVSKYSKTNEFEWFAETHTAYVYESATLKARDPEAFNLMRRVRAMRGLTT